MQRDLAPNIDQNIFLSIFGAMIKNVVFRFWAFKFLHFSNILIEFFGRVFGLTSVSTFFNSIGISTNFRLFAMKIQWNNQFFKKKLQLQLNLLLTKLTWSRVKSLMIWKWEINSSKLHYDELYLPLTQAACILVLYPF